MNHADALPLTYVITIGLAMLCAAAVLLAASVESSEREPNREAAPDMYDDWHG